VRDATKPRNGKGKLTTFGSNVTQFGREEMFTTKIPINIIAAIGLGLGAVFGMAGTFMAQPTLQAVLWAIRL
jgi:hypothetical protein